MEFELFTECADDDYAFGAEDIDNEQLVFEGEEGDEGQRCGICMDVVVDRGVLDCCQHWFCFSCIDNWASITNLCPLCQNEFQLITCVPVYDTIGNIQLDDDSYSRDDDWSIEGNNNTLSFPSYYIDENAVSCLEGDSCKIRGQSANLEEDPNLDTSIACDSCDLWYHAICVGFDPDGSCESSWLCPRCLADEASQKSESGPSNKNYSHEQLGDSTFPMNVSVSVADAGETAVVVSIINGNQETKAPDENLFSTVNNKDLIIGNQENEEMNQIKLEKQLTEEIIKKPKIEPVEMEVELLNFKEETSISDGLRASELCDEYNNNTSHESADKYETTGEVEEEKNVSNECTQPADKNRDKKGKTNGVTGAKRKQRDSSGEERETKIKKQNTAKIVKTEPKKVARKRKVVTDIKDIVQGPYRKPSEDKGLRIKKIMRRETNDKESLTLVQNLRKEIRDAVRNRSSKELGDNLFDPNLLAAFRAALAGQTTETKRPPLPPDLKAKKALLQKGTVRENLTKKIYGVGGKRKRAWTRDCEIEFWKHRCSKVSKPEKIETLKSVLGLLRKGPTVVEFKKENTENDENAPGSILSRLYVADSSVFPRKADIKPLLAPKSPERIGASVKPADSLVAIPCIKGNKVISNKGSKSTGGSSLNAQKISGNGSNDIKVDKKVDKKKWALEVLARKTAVTGNNSTQGQDNAVLKGNYPLLAKLPVDMRPTLAQSRHNKIPVSVRQAQLYRLTEHFLKKTNKPVTQPSAEIELAVADAINIEKSVADKSNSKLVYINLCSQELLHKSNDTNPEPTPVLDETSQTTTTTTDDLDVNEALKNAGLLSDSPPDSPIKESEDGPDNVFDMDSQQELDIYGDFEYDLEDGNLIGVTAIKNSKVQETDTRIKMVFSTLESSKSDSGWRFEDCEDDVKEKGLVEGGEEEVLDECEALYGPDKEPLIEKYPDLVTENIVAEAKEDRGLNLEEAKKSELVNGNCSENLSVPAVDLLNKPQETVETKKKSQSDKELSEKRSSVFKKVEAYIKEHIRPLCKSGVITVDQYRWAVEKTTEKIMKYHSKDTNANFLIKEGEKVKKLAEQYVEAAQNVKQNNK